MSVTSIQTCHAEVTSPGLVLGPLGLVEQTTIDEDGNNMAKLRMMHDQSFAYDLELISSVNKWVIEESLSVCVYGFTLRRMLHTIIALRKRYPNVAIFITKFDYKSAYRRLHLRARTAPLCTVTTIG